MKISVISGGQTGADLGGLWAARLLEVETGGRAPAGWQTLLGPKPGLARFGLMESAGGYRERTIENVRAADLTLICSRNLASPGTKLTINEARRAQKPLFVVRERADDDLFTARDHLLRAVNLELDQTLNVAGNATQNWGGAFALAFESTWFLLCSWLEATDDPRLARREQLTEMLSLDALASSLRDQYEVDG